MSVEPTTALARFVATSDASRMSDGVRHEAKRALVNWLGCAVGASRHDTVTRAIAALAPFAGREQATILGRAERFDMLHAALIKPKPNGMLVPLHSDRRTMMTRRHTIH
jgi:2-methylcitrate dehydratase PrpD